MATFLLAEGANINCKDATGKTPLHLAVEAATKNKKYDMVQLLMSKNANPRVEDECGESPEGYAKGNEKLLESLQKKILPGRPSRPRDFTNMPKRAPAPTNNDQLTACKAFKATVVKFFNKAGNVTYDKTTPSIYEYLYTEEDKPAPVPDGDSKAFKTTQKATYTWIHLPANNTAWVEALFRRLNRHVDSNSMASSLHEGDNLYGRYMIPQAREIKVFPNNNEVPERKNMSLFIPFLNFESSSMFEGTKKIMKNPTKRNIIDIPNGLNDKVEPFIRGYINSTDFHPRRSLDQFYYYMLGDENIDKRDLDQVVYRWATERNKDAKNAGKYLFYVKDPKLIMVDQLWLWIIDGDTVVSCFPQPLTENSGGDALEDILKSIESEARVPTESAIQLASLIVSHCVGLLDRKTFDYDQRCFQEYFEDSIAKEVNNEAILFKEYEESLRDPPPNPIIMCDILKEATSMDTIKDIRDEINTTMKVLRTQQSVLSELFKILHPKDKEREEDWTELADLDYLRIVEANKNIFCNLEEEARSVHDALRQLLNLKQKQANILEAKATRKQSKETAKQGDTMLTFTIVTIIFLPMSFLSSFFALSVSQFPRNQANGNVSWDLAQVSRWIFGMTAVLCIPLLLLAFNAHNMKKMAKRTFWSSEKGKHIDRQRPHDEESTIASRESCDISDYTDDEWPQPKVRPWARLWDRNYR
ncbi:hypothetical protein BZA77DRAFT_125803 [Pyronema omphalodes]|nr:hypothetical protein BZA77DRAFT_125803 [Pyronema omphalodes]